jgi:hypothetical protein
VLSKWLADTFKWFFALPDPQRDFLLVVVPLSLTAVATALGWMIPPVRRSFQRRLVWRGSPTKVQMNPYGIRHSGGNKHYIVFPDVTITNRGREPETLNAELLLQESFAEYRHTHTVHPEIAQVPEWEVSQWSKRNELLRFPLNLAGKQSVHGHIAFCVWTLPGDVPESRNSSELRIIDLSTRKTIHRCRQSGLTMLLGSYRPSA